MADVGFVHLHVHSAFSLLEGALTIKKLAELAKADKQPAMALTDTSNLFGALEFSEKFAESGVQPIVGATIAVEFADQGSGARRADFERMPAAARASGALGGWLRQSSGADERGLPGDRSERALRHHHEARPACGRAHRPDRRAGGAARPGHRGGARGPRGLPPRTARDDLRRPPLRRAAAPRHRERGPDRAAPDRTGL